MDTDALAGPAADGARILVADDDQALTAALTAALHGQGYLVRTVARGEQVLPMAQEFRPDLVLLDVMMPLVNGWEALSRLRSDPQTGAVPVIMLTAADTEAAKVKGFTLGADDYVTKPFSLHELRCRVAAVLRRVSVQEPSPGGVSRSVQVVSGSTGIELIRCKDIRYVEGIRNYTYVYTAEERFLSRITLGALDERQLPGFMRVHRSYIVNLDHVRGCGWAGKSSYRLHLATVEPTEVPVSRSLVSEVQRRLGLRA